MSNNEGFIIEFIAMGNTVKVTCVDPRDGREVSTIGPANAPRSQLTQAAIRKMKYVIEKEKS
ncbi:DUF6898 family protein [Pseudemcibacter aquimaris]|uniref:DUF6898 family protein n=1 Tax=Pseudemcibacter aquimaris TaxID=2857064 RepID=UPI002010FC2D|nr:hypothetical protein [Pseudemcibacter aquimaris]MCC3860594.1 hypothetical protein [Pseudemcibacter aquimaris]WDU59415.1 hypothetical protein KW060_03960 [Pseudemcibacter aquimaris]